MNKKIKFPKIKKTIDSFIHDEEGSMLRSKAAAVGPLAVGALVVMNKEMTMTVEASKFHSHASHRSHASGHSSHLSHSNNAGTVETVQTPSVPSHSSHSSGSTSGFSHTAGTFSAEIRNWDNN